MDLRAGLASGEMSCALYHTAGKGTRLAPLPGSENNNKPGVKLPVPGSGGAPLTILESVVKQTGIYGGVRKGRLSVFWGDQVFVPSIPVGKEKPTHHADILCALGPMMGPEEWKARGMEKYGLIAVSGNGEGAQVEKVDHATAVKLLSTLGTVEKVGASLGSFSVSWPLLTALVDEFRTELDARTGQLDTDPHFWMPLTLEEDAYVEIMGGKGASSDTSKKHFARIQRVKSKLQDAEKDAEESMGMFGAVDVGDDAFWWDFGQLKLFSKNTSLLLEDKDNVEANAARKFFGASIAASDDVPADVELEGTCLVANSIFEKGRVANSALCNVKCDYIDAEGATVINVVARRITAPKGSIIYNVTDDSELGVCCPPDGVLVGLHDEAGMQVPVFSSQKIDGGKAWKHKVAGNKRSFEDIYLENREADIVSIEAARNKRGADVWASIHPKVS